MKKNSSMKPLMMGFKYGDIVLIDFNPVRGAEISKIRPAIIVSRDILNKYSPLCIVVPITSNATKILPFHLFIAKSKLNGLKNDSKILPEQIKSLDKSRIVKKLGTLDKKQQSELEQKIMFVLNQRDLI